MEMIERMNYEHQKYLKRLSNALHKLSKKRRKSYMKDDEWVWVAKSIERKWLEENWKDIEKDLRKDKIILFTDDNGTLIKYK